MEKEILKIVELKKSHKKVNKALIAKVYNSVFAVFAALAGCGCLKNYIDNGNWFSLSYSIFMLVYYINFLLHSRRNTDIINENLDKDIDYEELMDEVELSK